MTCLGEPHWKGHWVNTHWCFLPPKKGLLELLVSSLIHRTKTCVESCYQRNVPPRRKGLTEIDYSNRKGTFSPVRSQQVLPKPKVDFSIDKSVTLDFRGVRFTFPVTCPRFSGSEIRIGRWLSIHWHQSSEGETPGVKGIDILPSNRPTRDSWESIVKVTKSWDRRPILTEPLTHLGSVVVKIFYGFSKSSDRIRPYGRVSSTVLTSDTWSTLKVIEKKKKKELHRDRWDLLI